MYKDIEKKIGLVILVLYVAGFLTWNAYLSHFGFFEFDLLQTRFISAGFLCLAIPGIPLFLFGQLWNKFSKLNIVWQAVSIFAWAVLFGTFAMSYVPQYLGGSKPFLASVVMEPEMAKAFNLMGYSYPVTDNDSIETIRGCKIYENRDQVLMGFGIVDKEKTSTTTIATSGSRVLYIGKEKIQALSVLPQDQSVELYGMFESTLVCDSMLKQYGVKPILFK